jgi:hypothetical protein
MMWSPEETGNKDIMIVQGNNCGSEIGNTKYPNSQYESHLLYEYGGTKYFENYLLLLVW